MAYSVRKRTVVEEDDSGIRDEVVTRDAADPDDNLAARIIYIIGGTIMGLLAIRFLLSLLGANQANGFANLIYSLSYPFAAPFFGLFSYSAQLGVARFEFETLVAIAVYALLTWFLIRVVTAGRTRTNYR